VLAHFAPLLARGERSLLAVLSAKVGSIGDNRLGGWYSYRASKAALNMLLKTAAIELARTHPRPCWQRCTRHRGLGPVGPVSRAQIGARPRGRATCWRCWTACSPKTAAASGPTMASACLVRSSPLSPRRTPCASY
jgi:hypothetical protein